MATASVTYTFVASTTADPSEVNQNFTDLVNFANGSVVHLDGSKAMTGRLTLAALDPTSTNHATRKAYVDTFGKGIIDYVQVTSNQTSISNVTDLTGLTLTWTAEADRAYRIVGKGLFDVSASGVEARMLITLGDNTQLQSGSVVPASTTRPASLIVEIPYYVPGAGSVTVKLRAAALSTGSCGLIASSSSPAYLAVFDVGEDPNA